MPSLGQAAQERLREYPRIPCPACAQPAIRDYCRQCDEFFSHCHCPDPPHAGHRTYEPLVRGADLALQKHPTFHGFSPHTQAAHDWIARNIPDPQRFGDMLLTSPETGAALLQAMTQDGLIVMEATYDRATEGVRNFTRGSEHYTAEVLWDKQDPHNVGWAYRISSRERGTIDSGPLQGTDPWAEVREMFPEVPPND